MYDCMEGDRRLLFEAMVLPLSELTAQAGRKPSLVDNAYVALKEVIRDGVLPPRYQGSEQEIAGKLNMSRTPVHEAIIRLQSEGLVKILPKRGVLVCSISPDDMRERFPVVCNRPPERIETCVVESLSMWPLQLPDSWGEAYSRFCEVGIGRTFQTPS